MDIKIAAIILVLLVAMFAARERALGGPTHPARYYAGAGAAFGAAFFIVLMLVGLGFTAPVVFRAGPVVFRADVVVGALVGGISGLLIALTDTLVRRKAQEETRTLCTTVPPEWQAANETR